MMKLSANTVKADGAKVTEAGLVKQFKLTRTMLDSLLDVHRDAGRWPLVRTNTVTALIERGLMTPMKLVDGDYRHLLTELGTGVAEAIASDRAVAKAQEEWPAGTLVAGTDTAGQSRTGTLYGADYGVVLAEGHESYGRAYTGVWWDDDPELSHRIPRNRVFVDTLTRI